jgi:hypothetical protein
MYPLGVDCGAVDTVAADLDPAGWSWQRRVIVDRDCASAALFWSSTADKQQHNQQATTAH